MRLKIELVPKSTWSWNVRSEVTSTRWDQIRRGVYAKANYLCEICGGKGSKHPVECHEKWQYDDTTHVQTLVGLEALCPKCHMVRHIGLTFHRGLGHVALAHLVKVNNISLDDAEKMVETAFTKWAARSTHEWKLDLSWLSQVR